MFSISGKGLESTAPLYLGPFGKVPATAEMVAALSAPRPAEGRGSKGFLS